MNNYIKENIALLTWKDFCDLLFECIDEKTSIDYGISDWKQYKNFFEDRIDDKFLLKCYALKNSQI